MTRFSDRIGVTLPPSLARDGMPPELRTALWNLLHGLLFEDTELYDAWRTSMVREFYSYHHLPLDKVQLSRSSQQMALSKWWFDERRRWWEFYNTIDHLSSPLQAKQEHFRRRCNEVFAFEGSRFRFVGTELTEITDRNETAAVDEALALPDKFSGAREHIATALRLLAQRPEPDYRNSIRESISAVESTLKVLTGMVNAPLGDALKAFSRSQPIHGALFSGLGSLYGYSSNEHGIRHALIEADANVGFAEAKFMVVACAAFVNFLIIKGAV